MDRPSAGEDESRLTRVKPPDNILRKEEIGRKGISTQLKKKKWNH